jgi:hypothetical protein
MRTLQQIYIHYKANLPAEVPGKTISNRISSEIDLKLVNI